MLLHFRCCFFFDQIPSPGNCEIYEACLRETELAKRQFSIDWDTEEFYDQIDWELRQYEGCGLAELDNDLDLNARLRLSYKRVVDWIEEIKEKLFDIYRQMEEFYLEHDSVLFDYAEDEVALDFSRAKRDRRIAYGYAVEYCEFRSGPTRHQKRGYGQFRRANEVRRAMKRCECAEQYFDRAHPDEMNFMDIAVDW